ncbi:hypothetical protein PUN28_010697 [Cardiocondyla obscurior]|uniref:Uncharacterized protein n=1 Tax=Cardiocondyla obscurior TaxID=286306 RepID=A0AAW2FIT0_9HYME
MNYVHNNSNRPSRSAIYSCILILSRTLLQRFIISRLSSFHFFSAFFFSLTFITLHRNIFVLGVITETCPKLRSQLSKFYQIAANASAKCGPIACTCSYVRGTYV